jgi:arylsulfatase A-like enzyme
MQHSDIGHENFTSYCNNIHKADFAVSRLWKTIQETPGLKDDTVLIIAPEFGRNLAPNSMVDGNGKFAIDHTGDDNSQQIFCMVLGPAGIVRQNIEIASQTGETIDIVPTIAHILGFYDDIPKSIVTGRFLQEAFV